MVVSCPNYLQKNSLGTKLDVWTAYCDMLDLVTGVVSKLVPPDNCKAVLPGNCLLRIDIMTSNC